MCRPWIRTTYFNDSNLHRKEVIQPHLPRRLPCYDFTPITDLTFDGWFHCWLPHRLRVLSTFVVWRVVCTRPGNVFTAACWSAITSDSDFMQASCSLQSELRACFWVWLHLAASLPSIKAHCSTCVAQDIRGMMTWRHPHLPPCYPRQSPMSSHHYVLAT